MANHHKVSDLTFTICLLYACVRGRVCFSQTALLKVLVPFNNGFEVAEKKLVYPLFASWNKHTAGKLKHSVNPHSVKQVQ